MIRGKVQSDCGRFGSKQAEFMVEVLFCQIKIMCLSRCRQSLGSLCSLIVTSSCTISGIGFELLIIFSESNGMYHYAVSHEFSGSRRLCV